ncbi:MAG: hypothetical protein ACTSWN_03590 [Promethearchaeota archaeon]
MSLDDFLKPDKEKKKKETSRPSSDKKSTRKSKGRAGKTLVKSVTGATTTTKKFPRKEPVGAAGSQEGAKDSKSTGIYGYTLYHLRCTNKKCGFKRKVRIRGELKAHHKVCKKCGHEMKITRKSQG